MMRTLLLLVACLAPISFAKAIDGGSEALPAVEKKLLGDWEGGPCMGTIRFAVDGTFTREHYSPGNNRLVGKWTLRWDALPPTLIMKCETSDDPDRLGKDLVVKLVQLNDDVLRYQFADEPPAQYDRVKK